MLVQIVTVKSTSKVRQTLIISISTSFFDSKTPYEQHFDRPHHQLDEN
jgi:hypothetical protein